MVNEQSSSIKDTIMVCKIRIETKDRYFSSACVSLFPRITTFALTQFTIYHYETGH